MDMNIREAVESDVGDLVKLNGEVQHIHVSLFPEFFRQTDPSAVADWFRGQLRDQAAGVFVAIVDANVVGYLILREVTRKANIFSQTRRYGYVDQICVAQELRHQGIGQALITWAADRARELGLDRLELDVWSANQSAKTAFQALGFTTYTEKMVMRLSSAGNTASPVRPRDVDE